MSLCLLGLNEGAFLVQYTRSWSDIPNPITPHWITFWEELVKTWSMRVAVLIVLLVGTEISCSREKEIIYIRNIAYFINFWQKAIYIYVNKMHSSFLKDIPFIPALIFAKAIWITVKVVSRKITIMNESKWSKLSFWIPWTGPGLRFISQESISRILQKDPYLSKWIFDKA